MSYWPSLVMTLNYEFCVFNIFSFGYFVSVVNYLELHMGKRWLINRLKQTNK